MHLPQPLPLTHQHHPQLLLLLQGRECLRWWRLCVAAASRSLHHWARLLLLLPLPLLLHALPELPVWC